MISLTTKRNNLSWSIKVALVNLFFLKWPHQPQVVNARPLLVKLLQSRAAMCLTFTTRIILEQRTTKMVTHKLSSVSEDIALSLLQSWATTSDLPRIELMKIKKRVRMAINPRSKCDELFQQLQMLAVTYNRPWQKKSNKLWKNHSRIIVARYHRSQANAQGKNHGRKTTQWRWCKLLLNQVNCRNKFCLKLKGKVTRQEKRMGQS